jgi:hypothetical protein
MSTTSSAFDFRKSVSYDDARKREFHRLARRQLGLLAKALDLAPGSYDLRSNMAGIAVSGEITLHAEHIYIQVSQPFGGFDSGILIRTCKGRKDYVGGPNNFTSLDLLHDPVKLARMVKLVTHGDRP